MKCYLFLSASFLALSLNNTSFSSHQLKEDEYYEKKAAMKAATRRVEERLGLDKNKKYFSKKEDKFLSKGKNIKSIFKFALYDFEGGKTLGFSDRISSTALKTSLDGFDYSELEKIKLVNLINQGLINDESLIDLPKLLPNLKCLNVENTSVTSEGVRKFTEEHPEIKIYSSVQ